MRFLLSWIGDFVDIGESPAELAEVLTMAGLAVDEIEEKDGEVVFDFEITANRPDAMNHFGLAREVAAIYGRPLRPPQIDFTEDSAPASGTASIEILDPDLCPRYSARIVRGVEIKPSPEWMARRIELCGVRSINNIADLTNYVLLEIGHPTHAFDLDRLTESKIVVRRAARGELMRTLDGVKRELSPDQLVIADAARCVALAGVMGGEETEISATTRNVLLESAWFLPNSIRRTTRHFNLHTEASHRFARGADINATTWATDRLAALLGAVSPGKVLRGQLDAYPSPLQRPAISLRRAQLRRYLGVEVAEDEVARILTALGFLVELGESGWRVSLPTHRLDVEREVDLVEEVARIHGYGRILSTLPAVGRPAAKPLFEEEDHCLRSVAQSLGYHETISYAFISSLEAAEFGSHEAVPIKNPISELQDVMRNSGVPAMVRALEWNLNRGQRDVRLIEVGRLYQKANGSFREPGVVTLALTGDARPDSVSDKSKEIDFYDLKADVEAILARFALPDSKLEESGLPEYYVRGRAARLLLDGQLLARWGEIDRARLQQHKLRQPIWIAELFLDHLYPLGLRQPSYQPVPRVPKVERDFSFYVPEGVPFRDIAAIAGGQPDLESLVPVEVFRGKPVPDGFYSLLLRATWQRRVESLTDEEVSHCSERIVAALSANLGIRQRKD